MSKIGCVTGDSYCLRDQTISLFLRNVVCGCALGLILVVSSSAHALVTGFVEDFDDGKLANWSYDQRVYGLTEENYVLRVDYHRTTPIPWANFNFTLPDPIDASAFPYISIRIKSDVTTLLILKPDYGGPSDWLQIILPDDNYWHTYVCELMEASNGALNIIYMYLDGGSESPISGTVLFDDLRIGDTVVIEVVTSELEQWIQCATTLYESSEEGTEEGQYVIGSKAILKAAIDSAKGVFDSESPTQQQIDMATADLVEAGTAFQVGVVTRDVPPADGELQIGGVALTFGIPIKVPNINTRETGELDPHISANGLELYFRGDYPGFNWDLFVATRPTTRHPWEERQRLVGVNDSCHVEGPCTSSDGLTLYFSGASEVGGTDYFPNDTHWANRYDIWTSTRPASSGRTWSKPVKVGPPVSTPTYAEWWPSISTDGLELYFTRSNNTAPGFFIDLYVSTRPTTQDPWGWPVRLPQPINGSGDYDHDSNPCISADGRMLYFNSTREENGHYTEDGRPITTKDIWVTTRHTKSDPWSEPVNVGAPVNTAEMEYGPGISADGRWLFFSRYPIYSGPGLSDIWQAEINPPVVDSNGIRLEAEEMVRTEGVLEENLEECRIVEEDVRISSSIIVPNPSDLTFNVRARGEYHGQGRTLRFPIMTLFLDNVAIGGWQVESVLEQGQFQSIYKDYSTTVPVNKGVYKVELAMTDEPVPWDWDLIVDFIDVNAVFLEEPNTVDPNGVNPNIADPYIEGFETGDFGRFDWSSFGDADWAVTSDEYNSGTNSARAGPIDDNRSTTLKLTLDCMAGEVSFYYKVSCEQHYDYLRFYIDGTQQEQWSGNEDWTQVSFPVRAGRRTFEWTYSKDDSSSSGSDTTWIDDIVFPIE